ncbi:hypothetical protein ACQ4PT_042290 [Festuca glaucescens]
MPFAFLLRDLVPLALLFLLLIPLYRHYMSRSSKTSPMLPTYWPVVGMLPSILANFRDVHGYVTALLAASGPGHSYEVRGPAVTPSLRFFCTCDPANVRHIFVSNFHNYPKGEDFASVFDTMGGSFFNANGESWRRQRARVQQLMASPRLVACMSSSCQYKVEKGLVSALSRAASTRVSLDLQELFMRRELAPIVASHKESSETTSGITIFKPEETKPLVYLQAALFESMRLYPPGPIERKAVLNNDMLPSGHEVRAGDTVLISLFAMARMERVWGQDCADYRPERWVSENPAGAAMLRHVPVHMFMPFNAGPRSCLGKDVSVAQMKSVVAAVVWNFDLEVVGGHAVEPKQSVVLQMKSGLLVTATKR